MYNSESLLIIRVLIQVFPRTIYTEEMKLPAAIKATGHDIKDVKAIVIGHLHLDHAGGLEHFMGSDVPIYVSDVESSFHVVMATDDEAGTRRGVQTCLLGMCRKRRSLD